MKSAEEVLRTSPYVKQLNDGRWDDFRRQIIRDTPWCECCRIGETVLQVHHLFYDSTRQLWEYQRDEVMVLCVGCHKELHEQLKNFRKYVFKNLNPNQFRILNGALAVGLTQYSPLVFVHAMAEFASNRPLVENHARAHGLTASGELLKSKPAELR